MPNRAAMFGFDCASAAAKTTRARRAELCAVEGAFTSEPPVPPLALLGWAEDLAATAGESPARGQNRRAQQPGLLRNGVIGNRLAGQQNHLTLARYPLGGGAGPSPGFQLLPLGFIKPKSSGAGEHAPVRSRCRPIVDN
jgi:hypothetical protein